MVYYCLFVYGG